MVPLHVKYSTAIQLAERADIDPPPAEHEGRLYFIGTVRASADVAKIWEAIRTVPDWDAEVIADIRSTDFGATVMTFAAGPRPVLARAAGGLSGDDDLGSDPFPARPAG
jgi:hypothetical protein